MVGPLLVTFLVGLVLWPPQDLQSIQACQEHA